jgi:hypothetical protein
MIKTVGTYRSYDENFVLFLSLNKKNFDSLKQHICMNMFFAYRRVAKRFGKVVLASIGDHLDSDENQNLLKADICIEVDTQDTVQDEDIKTLDSHHTWFVCCICDKEAFMFSLDKESQYIKDRKYLKDVGQ